MKVKTHLMKEGDTLFGALEWECGNANEIGGRGVIIPFGWCSYTECLGMLREINCRKCMASEEYRKACDELKVVHPFRKAALKAHETMRKKGRITKERKMW